MTATSSPTLFYTRLGHQIIPTANALIRPRQGVFAIARAADKILMVEESLGRDIWDLPGGGIEAGETHDQAIRREWEEETGLPFALQGPLKTHHHIRGYYADDIDEFWIYDQTFYLYDFTDTPKTETWTSPEDCRIGWKPIATLAKLRANKAHCLGIAACLPESGL